MTHSSMIHSATFTEAAHKQLVPGVGEVFVPSGLGEFIAPHRDAVLREYLKQVSAWHGYMRLLMLPSEEADIRMPDMYVPLSVAPQWLPPLEKSPSSPQLQPAMQALREHKRLVVLGDPGSGKSTLVNWVASQLAQADQNDVARSFYPDRERLIPLPLILRELTIKRGLKWDEILAGFIQQHPLTERLDREKLLPRIVERLESGQVFVLVDGLDEVGNLETRRDLRAALWDAMQRYPVCRWLLTSRVIGYDALRFEYRDLSSVSFPGDNLREHTSQTEELVASNTGDNDIYEILTPEVKARGGRLSVRRIELASLSYVAPFDDSQVAQFSQNWYVLRDPNSTRAVAEATRFYERIRSDKATLRLARTPHLLTFMAVLFRGRAHLPHGRALLYNEITHAYLEAIDRYRGMTEWAEYPFDQKKRWLARVGFKLQLRRISKSNHANSEYSTSDGPREILVDATTLTAWIADAMTESGYDGSRASRFVDFVQRRSGLLIPRGVDVHGQEQFAFLHLSLQEYFTACYLEEQICAPKWVRTGTGPPGTSRDELRLAVHDVTWRETFVFLFELLAARPGWPEDLCEQLFGPQFADLQAADWEMLNATVLVAHLAADPHSGLPASHRQDATVLAVAWEAKWQSTTAQRIWHHQPAVFAVLLRTDGVQLDRAWHVLVSHWSKTKFAELTLAGCSVSDVKWLASLPSLQRLDLSNTTVTDVAPLALLPNLRHLGLRYTAVRVVAPLAALKNLRELWVTNAAVSDEALACFHDMRQQLGLHDCSIA